MLPPAPPSRPCPGNRRLLAPSSRASEPGRGQHPKDVRLWACRRWRSPPLCGGDGIPMQSSENSARPPGSPADIRRKERHCHAGPLHERPKCRLASVLPQERRHRSFPMLGLCPWSNELGTLTGRGYQYQLRRLTPAGLQPEGEHPCLNIHDKSCTYFSTQLLLCGILT